MGLNLVIGTALKDIAKNMDTGSSDNDMSDCNGGYGAPDDGFDDGLI